MPTAHQPSETSGLRPELSVNPMFAGEPVQVPRFSLPDGSLAADVAYQIVHDELMLDGNARLNLATFVTTWAEPQARQLMSDSFDKNMIDKDEYPRTADLEQRCVKMLAELWHAPDPQNTIGCSTTGSSEACMLGGLALKRRWQHARRAAGKSTDRPNIVMGIIVQVCWDKFANFFEVEPRLVPMEGDRLHLGAAEAVAQCDENTIGVVAILGSTFDGSYEPVAELPYSVFDVSAGLREAGWLVPAYTFPAHRQDLSALRIVVRNGFSHDLADLLLDDLRRLLDRLGRQTAPQRGSESASFSHGADSRRKG